MAPVGGGWSAAAVAAPSTTTAAAVAAPSTTTAALAVAVSPGSSPDSTQPVSFTSRRSYSAVVYDADRVVPADHAFEVRAFGPADNPWFDLYVGPLAGSAPDWTGDGSSVTRVSADALGAGWWSVSLPRDGVYQLKVKMGDGAVIQLGQVTVGEPPSRSAWPWVLGGSVLFGAGVVALALVRSRRSGVGAG